jgi:Holliday junction resolvase RusA-like endonuclease
MVRPGKHYEDPDGIVLRASAPLYPTAHGREDVDNLAKAVLDALGNWRKQGCLLWHDDAQVVTLNASKRYVLAGEEPGVRVSVRALRIGTVRRPKPPHRGL